MPLLSLLLPFLRSKDGRYCLVIAALLLLLAGACAVVVRQALALAAKPKIEVREKIVEKVVRVAGPVKVVERIIKAPGGETIIERTTERAAVKTETGRETESDRREEAACPPRTVKARHLVAEFGASSGAVPIGARAGMSFLNALPISPLIEAGYRRDGHDRVYGAAGIRF